MRFTRTVKVLYSTGLATIFTGLFLVFYAVSLLQWQYGDGIKGYTPDSLPLELRPLANAMIHPYQLLGTIIIVFGAVVFFLLPTIIAQISHEMR